LVYSNHLPVAEYLFSLWAHRAHVTPDQKRSLHKANQVFSDKMQNIIHLSSMAAMNKMEYLGKCPDAEVRAVFCIGHATVAHFKHVRI
jgi:hypothetical protein